MTCRGMVKEVVYKSGHGHYDIDDQPLDVFIGSLEDIVKKTREEYRKYLRIQFIEVGAYEDTQADAKTRQSKSVV